MFCGECGTKNNKGDLFCSNCGAKLEVEKPKKVLNKKNKLLIIIAVVLIVILFGSYKIVSGLTSPKNIAKKYISAVVNNDSDKLYKYLGIDGDKTFVTKNSFKKIIESNKNDIDNYSITDVEYGEGKLTAKVRFSYTIKSSNGEKHDTVSLTKQKGKKYLFFDNWKISNSLSSNFILKDFIINAPKGAKLVFNDVDVSDKYLDKNKSSKDEDVYVLPQVFKTKSVIKVTLDNGIEFEKEVIPYNSYTVKFDEDSLSDDEKEKLIGDSKKIISSLYDAAIAEKEYESIKSNYEKADKKLEAKYSDFLSEIESATNKLTKIAITSASVYDLSLTDEGNIEVELKVNYDYEVEYTNYKKETLTSKKSNYSYMTIVVTKDKDSYELVNIKELKTYFYR